MTQEDNELLLKDLCSRLPYGVKFLRGSWNDERDQEISVIEVLEDIDKDGYINNTKVYDIGDIKPYLFPMSSMTEEQSKVYHELINGMFGTSALINFEVLTDFFNANHLDYRGLIKKGLAIDATNLNIYYLGRVNK